MPIVYVVQFCHRHLENSKGDRRQQKRHQCKAMEASWEGEKQGVFVQGSLTLISCISTLLLITCIPEILPTFMQYCSSTSLVWVVSAMSETARVTSGYKYYSRNYMALQSGSWAALEDSNACFHNWHSWTMHLKEKCLPFVYARRFN